MTNTETMQGRAGYQKVGLVLGPAVAVLMLLLGAPEGLEPAAWRVAALGVWMAIWWATEAAPIAVTALLPVVMFPVLGIASVKQASGGYFNATVMLFLGGFILAFAIQRWGLHRRIALTVLAYAGKNGRSLIGSFMLVAALLSMWMMNTSTTMMLLPIAVSIITVIHQSVKDLSDKARDDFQCALLLGVAYGATIGGMSTLVGTAPNALFAGFMRDNFEVQVDFASWMMVGVPLSVTLLPLCWLLLTRVAFSVDFRMPQAAISELHQMREELGPMTVPEKRVAVVFSLVAVSWMTRPLLLQVPGLGMLEDAMIAIGGAIILFLLPSGDKSDPVLLRWRYAEQLPWGVLILFGGGLTLASAVNSSGLALWLGNNLQALTELPLPILIAATATMIIFLTELTSNLTTTTTFLPVVAAVAVSAGIDPILLTAAITMAASCAFMLPVATPPNAIVFGSGLLTIPKMAKAGFLLNLVGIVVVSTVAITLAPRFLN
ncbi:MAG: DASS family sodium-coupled anion symporter [Pseudomonadota bacterium]